MIIPKLWAICCIHNHKEPWREKTFSQLSDRLCPQLSDAIEMPCYRNANGIPIGEARNKLLDAAARGLFKYVSFVDDDDMVPANFVSRIAEALLKNPDCVGFYSKRFADGRPNGRAKYSMEFTKNRNVERDGMMFHERMPSHLTPVKTELALKVRFPAVSMGEDINFSERLRPLLKSEIFLPDPPLYEYYWRTKGLVLA